MLNLSEPDGKILVKVGQWPPLPRGRVWPVGAKEARKSGNLFNSTGKPVATEAAVTPRFDNLTRCIE